jgi:hypothetical protein
VDAVSSINPEEGAAILAAAIASLNEVLAPVMEASAGHMQLAMANGFNAESASRMGADYHQVLMQIVRQQAFGKPA